MRLVAYLAPRQSARLFVKPYESSNHPTPRLLGGGNACNPRTSLTTNDYLSHCGLLSLLRCIGEAINHEMTTLPVVIRHNKQSITTLTTVDWWLVVANSFVCCNLLVNIMPV